MNYYRYDNLLTTGGVSVYLTEFTLVKKTPKGAWIESFGLKRFVRDEAHKQFACPTKEQALESFRARKKRQIKILTKQLELAKRALEISNDPRELEPWNEQNSLQLRSC